MKLSAFGLPLFACLCALCGETPVASADKAPGHAFWRVERGPDGVWWARSPGGEPTFLRGVDHANWNGHFCEALGLNPYREENRKRFGDNRGAWEEETLSRLADWGFNALGAGCSPELENRGLPHCAFLGLGEAFCRKGADHALGAAEGVPGTAFPNVFHPDFPAFCDARAQRLCSAERDNPNLFGYFFDNELAWYGRGTAATGLYDAALAMPEGSPARLAAERTAEVGQADGAAEEFLRLAARRYFETIAAAILRHDPNHLLLGCRFAGLNSAHRVVWEEAGKVCDVVTFNQYPWVDLDTGVVYTTRSEAHTVFEAYAERHAWTGRPLMVTEWSFPALDSGLPCTGGAGQRFRTQDERVRASETFVRSMMSMPFLVGYDYFMWVDEPAQGISRKFPEDSNYGLVDGHGEPYAELVAMFSRLHPQAEALHAEATPGHNRPGAVHRTPPAIDGFRRASADASFSRDGDAYRLAFPSGLVLSGCVGGPFLFDSCKAGGIDYGPFTAMLFHGAWQDIGRVTSAEWDPGRGMLRVSGEGRAGDKAFRITCEISGSSSPVPSFLVSVASVENTGSLAFSGGSVWLRQYAPWAGDKAVGGDRSVPLLWNAPSADRWIRASDGAWCGGLTYSKTVQHFTYWISPDGKPHPDAAFRPDGGITLSPGESYDPQGSIWMLAAFGTGGESGWKAFCETKP